MERVPKSDKSLLEKISTLEAENEMLYRTIEQMNSTLQRLIAVCIEPGDKEDKR